jgi:hypothetical protein
MWTFDERVTWEVLFDINPCKYGQSSPIQHFPGSLSCTGSDSIVKIVNPFEMLAPKQLMKSMPTPINEGFAWQISPPFFSLLFYLKPHFQFWKSLGRLVPIWRRIQRAVHRGPLFTCNMQMESLASSLIISLVILFGFLLLSV